MLHNVVEPSDGAPLEYQREHKVVVQEQEEQDNDDSDSNGLDCMLNLVDSDYDISEDDDDLL